MSKLAIRFACGPDSHTVATAEAADLIDATYLTDALVQWLADIRANQNGNSASAALIILYPPGHGKGEDYYRVIRCAGLDNRPELARDICPACGVIHEVPQKIGPLAKCWTCSQREHAKPVLAN